MTVRSRYNHHVPAARLARRAAVLYCTKETPISVVEHSRSRSKQRYGWGGLLNLDICRAVRNPTQERCRRWTAASLANVAEVLKRALEGDRAAGVGALEVQIAVLSCLWRCMRCVPID